MQLGEITLIPAVFLALGIKEQEDLLMEIGALRLPLLSRFDEVLVCNSEIIIYASPDLTAIISRARLASLLRTG